MSGSQEQLLGQIIANPRDIESRKVFADLMMEQSDPLGDFIRMQCQLAEIDQYDPQRDELEATVAKLIKKHRAKWMAAIKPLVVAAEFRCGFIEHVSVKAEHFSDRWESIVSSAPIRSLKLSGDRAELPSVADSVGLQRIDQLSLSSMRLGAAYGDPIFHSPHLCNVRTLNVGHNALGKKGVKSLLDAKHLKQLESLNLEDNRLGDEGMAVLAGSSLLNQVKHLSLDSSRVPNAGVVALAQSNRLENLESLRLERTGTGEDGLIALAQSRGFLPKKLHLLLAQLNTEAIVTAAEAGMFERTECLNLYWNQRIGDEGAKALVKASLPNLRYLNMNRCGLSDDGGAALLSAPWLKHVRELHLFDNQLGAESMRAMANNLPALKSLIRVDLKGNLIAINDLAKLAGIREPSSIRVLEFTKKKEQQIAYLEPLIRSGQFPQLRE